MMRFLLLFILSGLVAFLLGPFLPYWGIMLIIAGLATLVGGKGTTAFFAAALAVGMVWFFVPFFITLKTSSELPGKMSQILGLDQGLVLMGVTSFLGFLVGGGSALTGNRFRKLFEKDKIRY